MIEIFKEGDLVFEYSK